MQDNTVTEIIARFGHSQTKLAETLGVSRQAVHVWFKNGKIPLLRIYQLKEMMDNKEENKSE